MGIDIAGDEERVEGEEQFFLVTDLLRQRFSKKRLAKGVHRTVHSGEAGPAKHVKFAIEQLHAERIGHGYRVVHDNDIYQSCLQSRIHFECCPHSSILTGALPLSTTKHSIVKFAEDAANFSISRDDPTVTHATLHQEYRFLMDLGLSELDLVKSVSHKR